MITTATFTERVLIVLNPDGTLRGAHAETLRRILDGATVLNETMLPAEPLSPEALAGVLPNQAALAAQVVALQADLATCTSERDALAADKANLQAQVAELQADLATCTSERDALAADKTALEARVADLEAQQGGSAGGAPVLTAVQVRLGLLAGGITPEAVDAAIDGIADATQRATARTYWEYATQYHRDHPMIATFAGLLGLSEAQVDAMWEAAAAIV